MLTMVMWTGGGNDGLWSDAANWSPQAIPNSTDDVEIGSSGSPTVTIDDAESVDSLVVDSGATLSITGGSLSVIANSTLNGGFSMTGGSLTVSGTGVTFAASGATSITDADLFAQSGATLSLPNLASYSADDGDFHMLEAIGTNSSLELGGLTALSVANFATFDAEAHSGGSIDFSGLTQIDTPSVQFVSDGTGSQIDLSALTSFTQGFGADVVSAVQTADGSRNVVNAGQAGGSGGGGGSFEPSILQASDVGTILDGNLTTLDGVDVPLDGVSTISTSQFASFTNGLLTVFSGNYTLGGLTTLGDSNVDVSSGATLSLPGVTTYTESISSSQLTATGTGSTLELDNLTSLALADQLSVTIQALAGGTVDLPALTQIATSTVNLNSTGTNSTLDVSALTSIAITNTVADYHSSLSATSGGTILDGSLTSLDGTDLSLNGTNNLSTSQFTSYTNGDLTVTGGAYNLAALTDIDESDFYVTSGASLSLPGVTRYSATGINPGQNTSEGQTAVPVYVDPNGYTNNYWVATGMGSTLTLANLTSLTIQNGNVLNIEGFSHGTVSLPAGLSGPNVAMTVADDGQVELGGTSYSMPTISSTGPVDIPQLPAGMWINLDSEGTFTGTTFNVAQGDGVNIVNGTYTGTTTFNVAQGAVVDLTGGQIDVTTFAGTLTGSGAGTVQISGGRLLIGVGGLTLDFPGNMFQWSGGVIDAGQGGLTNLGTVNLVGDNNKGFYNDGIFDNLGTIFQSGAGNLVLGSDDLFATNLVNEAGALYEIQGTGGLGTVDDLFGNTYPSLINAGTVRKLGSGTATLELVFLSGVQSYSGTLNNIGTIEVDGGTLAIDTQVMSQVSASTLTGGSWSALNGATLQLPSGTAITNNQGNLTLGGAGATITGTSGLSLNLGSFTVTGGALFGTAGDLLNGGQISIGVGSTLNVAGNFSSGVGSTQNVQIGGTPASGQFGQIAVSQIANLAGTFNLSLVNGFGPSSGQDFPVMSYGIGSSHHISFTGVAPFFTQSFGTTTLDMIDNATNAVDLQIGNVTAPTTATAGQTLTVGWTVSNPGSQDATGSWLDRVYLSTTPTITGNSLLVGSVTHSGGLSAGDSYNESLPVRLPAIAGNYYVLVQTDSLDQVPDPNRANNTQTATTGQVAVSAAVLPLDGTANGVFSGANQEAYYQVTVPAGGALQFTLTSSAGSGATALYVSQGVLPTAYNYQYAGTNELNETITVPQVLSPGTYYVLAQSVSGSAALTSYTLGVIQTSNLIVTGISSYAGSNAGKVTVEVDGMNFAPDATVALFGINNGIATVDYVSPSQLFATFDLTGVTPGYYSLHVLQGQQSDEAATPFQVVAAPSSPPPLSVQLSVPQYVRSGRTGTIVVTYTNPSNNDMVAPLLEIDSSNSDVLFSTPDNPNDFMATAQILAVAPSGPAGILRPGQSGQVMLTLQSNDNISQDQIPITVGQITPGLTTDLASQEASLKPANMPSAAWDLVYSNLETMLGSTTDSYNAALAQAATYLGNIGESQAQLENVGQLWAFLAAQANADFPGTTYASATDASLSTPANIPLAL